MAPPAFYSILSPYFANSYFFNPEYIIFRFWHYNFFPDIAS